MDRQIFIGWDPREAAAYAVARSSLQRHLSQPIPVRGLVLETLVNAGLYSRPLVMRRIGDRTVMWDVLSGAPMATEHANARFLVPLLARSGWALFMDGDMLVRGDLAPLFDSLDPAKTLYCVQHRHEPDVGMKMDGQVQTRYARKNWSSFMVINCDHPANVALTLELINTAPGRDLHRLCWLDDADIGELGAEWNFLVGHSDPAIEPKVVHFTDGVPDMPGYESVAYADEWRAERRRWAA
ncbi:MAG: hypothetical protein Q8R82_21365 [Hyphomonadaceae bacterium]|nr:hypothetical protein [Hyphomonadaceae bacterium]